MDLAHVWKTGAVSSEWTPFLSYSVEKGVCALCDITKSLIFFFRTVFFQFKKVAQAKEAKDPLLPCRGRWQTCLTEIKGVTPCGPCGPCVTFKPAGVRWTLH